MDKTKIISLLPNSSLSFKGVSLGYTRGGVIMRFNISTELLTSQRYKEPVGAELTALNADISTNLWELNASNKTMLFYVFVNKALEFGALIVRGKTKDGSTHTFTFANVFVADLGDMTLGKSPEPIPITFRATRTADGNFVSIT